jgi:hypothetical protein
MHKSPSESSLRSLTMGELHDRIENDINWLVELWGFFCQLCRLDFCKNSK